MIPLEFWLTYIEQSHSMMGESVNSKFPMNLEKFPMYFLVMLAMFQILVLLLWHTLYPPTQRHQVLARIESPQTFTSILVWYYMNHVWSPLKHLVMKKRMRQTSHRWVAFSYFPYMSYIHYAIHSVTNNIIKFTFAMYPLPHILIVQHQSVTLNIHLFCLWYLVAGGFIFLLILRPSLVYPYKYIFSYQFCSLALSNWLTLFGASILL